MKRILGWLTAFALTGLSFPVLGLNFTFMADSPVASFNASDWKLLNAAADKALDSMPDGKKVVWKNPRTGNGGFFQPLSTTKKNGMRCRNLKMFFEDYRSDTDEYTFLFCRDKGEWRTTGQI